MSGVYEVFVTFEKEEGAQKIAKYLSNRFPKRVGIRKVNPDAHPE